MNQVYTVKLYASDGSCRTERKCFYFRYVKDVYVPYVWFECRFESSAPDIGAVKRVEFWNDNKLMHKGLADSIDICQGAGKKYTISIKSKGFTSLLCQNQPEPGIMTNVNLNSILRIFPEIPYITGANTGTLNYLYIKDGSTVWDAVCNLAFRLYNRYPFISDTNNVVANDKFSSTNFMVRRITAVKIGTRQDFTKIVSDIHMQDINGDYNVYYRNNQAAADRDIVRHKQIPLDRQFLYDPASAPDYKLKYSMRGMVYNYFQYIGYLGEDLLDSVVGVFPDVKNIHRIDIVFDGREIVTEIGNYNDGFFT